METLIPLLVQVVSGAVGGNIAGLAKQVTLGTAGNTIAGGIGGIILSQVLPHFIHGGAMMNGMAGTAISSGVGGVILTAIIGFGRKFLAKKV